MTPRDFDAWLRHMGLSERVAARALGCSPSTVGRMRRAECYGTQRAVTIDKTTALACAALAIGLEPWGKSDPMEPAEFDAWMRHTGLSLVRAGQALGRATSVISRLRNGSPHPTTGNPARADRRTALACAAIAVGLES